MLQRSNNGTDILQNARTQTVSRMSSEAYCHAVQSYNGLCSEYRSIGFALSGPSNSIVPGVFRDTRNPSERVQAYTSYLTLIVKNLEGVREFRAPLRAALELNQKITDVVKNGKTRDEKSLDELYQAELKFKDLFTRACGALPSQDRFPISLLGFNFEKGPDGAPALKISNMTFDSSKCDYDLAGYTVQGVYAKDPVFGGALISVRSYDELVKLLSTQNPVKGEIFLSVVDGAHRSRAVKILAGFYERAV